jgi:hypothetical protein
MIDYFQITVNIVLMRWAILKIKEGLGVP